LVAAQKESVNPEVIEGYEEKLIQTRQKQYELKERSDKNRKELKNEEEKIKGCIDCRKNCFRHEELKNKHESDKCCDKKKYEKEELKRKIERQLSNTKSNSKKIEKLKKEFRELNKHSLKNRVECPRFQEINQSIRKCLECDKQKAKKMVKIIPVPLQKVFLINSQDKPEIYLLAGEVVC
jgi:signal recognition particle GTPase